MTSHAHWARLMEELGVPSEEEIKALALGASPAARTFLFDAEAHLISAKQFCGDKTPWRELVELSRKNDPEQLEAAVMEEDGTQRPQVIYVDRGLDLNGIDPTVFNSANDFRRALDLIDEERARNKRNGSRGGRKAGTISHAIAAWLDRRGYRQSSNKKALVLDAMQHFGVKKTTVTNAITKHGLAKMGGTNREGRAT